MKTSKALLAILFTVGMALTVGCSATDGLLSTPSDSDYGPHPVPSNPSPTDTAQESVGPVSLR